MISLAWDQMILEIQFRKIGTKRAQTCQVFFQNYSKTQSQLIHSISKEDRLWIWQHNHQEITENYLLSYRKNLTVLRK